MRRRLVWATALGATVSAIAGLGLLRHLRGDKNDSESRAIQSWVTECDQGTGEACVALAEVYSERDDALAARYFRKGCDHNITRACTGLSRLYRLGRGVTKDPAMEAQFLKRAHELSPQIIRRSQIALPNRD
jgi:TPR repeat protein